MSHRGNIYGSYSDRIMLYTGKKKRALSCISIKYGRKKGELHGRKGKLNLSSMYETEKHICC